MTILDLPESELRAPIQDLELMLLGLYGRATHRPAKGTQIRSVISDVSDRTVTMFKNANIWVYLDDIKQVAYVLVHLGGHKYNLSFLYYDSNFIRADTSTDRLLCIAGAYKDFINIYLNPVDSVNTYSGSVFNTKENILRVAKWWKEHHENPTLESLNNAFYGELVPPPMNINTTS